MDKKMVKIINVGARVYQSTLFGRDSYAFRCRHIIPSYRFFFLVDEDL